MVRIGLKTLLNRTGRIDIVGEADSVATAVTEATRLKPAVVLMDLRLCDGSGIEACREIRAVCPDTRVLFLTSFGDDQDVRAALSGGASGYILKRIEKEALVRAIETVAHGQTVLHPSLAKPMLDGRLRPPTLSDESGAPALSPQEERVLALVAEGKTNKEIAAMLDLSDKTVKNYLSNAYLKLNVDRRSQAAVLFVRRSAK